MNKVSVVIIEDEARNQKLLADILRQSFPDLELVGIAGTVAESVKLIGDAEPEIILLDIQLRDGTGFEVLDGILSTHKPSIIFTTAYDQYALEAFKYSAVNYLLKPVDRNELRKAVDQAKSITKIDEVAALRKLLERMTGSKEDRMIAVSGLRNTEYVHIKDIVHIEAMGAYSRVFLQDGSSHTVSKVIKKYDEMLKSQGFFRVHQSHLINLDYVKSLNKGDCTLLLANGKEVGISRKRKEHFIQAMEKRTV